MAAGSKRRPQTERTAIGTFDLHQNPVALTISSKLDPYDFPNEPGAGVFVELVEEPGEEPYLEVHPLGGEEE